jgi:hypothetical protein
MPLESFGETSEAPHEPSEHEARQLGPDPQKASLERLDRVLPSLFISVAALILWWITPIYMHFEIRPVETTALTILGVTLVWWGTLKRYRVLMYVAVALLLATTTLETVTQPMPLSVPIVSVWPLRAILVILIAWSWAFLMRPPRWLNRALFAIAVPTLFIFGLWGGPALGASLFGWNVIVPVTNFTPYWLAIDSHNTIYATDASGDLIWVFDESGSPQGTIRAVSAPLVGTAGPGILPNGLIEELNLSKTSLFPAATPITATLNPVILDFCGIAVDPSDYIYTIDTSNLIHPTILRFDREGMVTARLPLPENYLSTKGCLAVDAEHIYVSSAYGQVFIMDHQAKVQREVQLTYRPLGITPTGKGDLLVNEPGIMNKIEISTGKIFTSTLPVPPGQVTIPYQSLLVRKNGELLVSDWAGKQVLRIDLATNKIIGTIGKPGFWPGEFQVLGGLAEDKEGRIYVADWQHRVIQRFTSDGKIDALWWAARIVPESPGGEVEREP